MNNANASAFPHLDESCQRVDETEHAPGLTKREYFAAMAMQGMLASEGDDSCWQLDKCSERAIRFADALLAELAK